MPITLNGDTGIQTPMYNGTITANAVTPSVNMKNRIINGGMGIWQRGTPITTSGGYTADRWTQVSGNSIVHTQSTDAPTGFTNSMQMAGTGSNIAQRIESVNCIGLGGATVTVSLWYKNSTGSDPLSLSLYYANSADNFGSVTQIGSNQTLSASPSSSWTYYTATFTNISANAINGLALYVFRGSSATATGLLTGVQLEVGSTATSFDYRPYGTELALCQRYYFRNTASATNRMLSAGGQCYTTTGIVANIVFPVPMRIAPTALEQTGTAGDYAVWNSSTSNVNCSSVVQFNGASIYIGRVEAIVASGLVAGNATSLLSSGTGSNAFLGWSAEL